MAVGDLKRSNPQRMEIRAIQLRMIIEWMDIKASEKQKKNATRRKKSNEDKR